MEYLKFRPIECSVDTETRFACILWYKSLTVIWVLVYLLRSCDYINFLLFDYYLFFTYIIWKRKNFFVLVTTCYLTVSVLYIIIWKRKNSFVSVITRYLTVELSAFEIPGFPFACTGFSAFLVNVIFSLPESSSAAPFSGCTLVCTVEFVRWWTVLWCSCPLHSQSICLLS